MISLPEVHNLNPIQRKHLTDQTEEHSTKCVFFFSFNVKVTKYKKKKKDSESFQIKENERDVTTEHDTIPDFLLL